MQQKIKKNEKIMKQVKGICIIAVDNCNCVSIINKMLSYIMYVSTIIWKTTKNMTYISCPTCAAQTIISSGNVINAIPTVP